MSDDVFTDPDDAESAATRDPEDGSAGPDGEWADVRMTDPEEGEWNVDAVVVDGRVEYVDLQIRPDLLADFIECLLDDVSSSRAGEILADVAAGQDLDVSDGVATE